MSGSLSKLGPRQGLDLHSPWILSESTEQMNWTKMAYTYISSSLAILAHRRSTLKSPTFNTNCKSSSSCPVCTLRNKVANSQLLQALHAVSSVAPPVSVLPFPPRPNDDSPTVTQRISLLQPTFLQTPKMDVCQILDVSPRPHLAPCVVVCQTCPRFCQWRCSIHCYNGICDDTDCENICGSTDCETICARCCHGICEVCEQPLPTFPGPAARPTTSTTIVAALNSRTSVFTTSSTTRISSTSISLSNTSLTTCSVYTATGLSPTSFHSTTSSSTRSTLASPPESTNQMNSSRLSGTVGPIVGAVLGSLALILLLSLFLHRCHSRSRAKNSPQMNPFLDVISSRLTTQSTSPRKRIAGWEPVDQQGIPLSSISEAPLLPGATRRSVRGELHAVQRRVDKRIKIKSAGGEMVNLTSEGMLHQETPARGVQESIAEMHMRCDRLQAEQAVGVPPPAYDAIPTSH